MTEQTATTAQRDLARVRADLAAIHRPYSDSPHCAHDGERWPCPTMRVASGGDGAQ